MTTPTLPTREEIADIITATTIGAARDGKHLDGSWQLKVADALLARLRPAEPLSCGHPAAALAKAACEHEEDRCVWCEAEEDRDRYGEWLTQISRILQPNGVGMLAMSGGKTLPVLLTEAFDALRADMKALAEALEKNHHVAVRFIKRHQSKDCEACVALARPEVRAVREGK